MPASTIADGIAVRDTSPKTLEYILQSVDRFISVDDEEIAYAILFLLEKQKLSVEGAGAVGVAALMHKKLPHLQGKKVAVVLSGGNVDVTLLSVIIEKGLLKSFRKMKLTVTLIELAIGFPFALWLAKGARSQMARAVFLALLTIPFFLDLSSRTIVWRAMVAASIRATVLRNPTSALARAAGSPGWKTKSPSGVPFWSSTGTAKPACSRTRSFVLLSASKL